MKLPVGWQRPALIIGAALALVGAGFAVVALTRDDAAPPTRTVPTPPSAEDDSAIAPELSPTERDALAVAARFLRSYVPYTYGQAPLRNVTDASAYLRRQLGRSTPRPPSSQAQGLHPEVTTVQFAASGSLGIEFRGYVVDERNRYSLLVNVWQNDAGRWEVTSVR